MTSAYQSSATSTSVVRRSHPDGPEGAAISLAEVSKKIREAKNDIHVQGWAGRVLVADGKPKDPINQAQALLDAFRKQTMYVPDPVGTEMIKAPKHTLCLDGAVCMPAGDCDDRTVALAAACMSVGIPVKVVGQAFQGGSVPTHVLFAIETKFGWKKIDPSHDTFSVGESFPATKEWWIDPLDDGKPVTGATLGDFVGVGRLPRGLGDAPAIDRGVAYDAVVAQAELAIDLLAGSVTHLNTALGQVQQTRSLLRSDQPFDAEPFAITSVADFPLTGLWTPTMAVLASQIAAIGTALVEGGRQAIAGQRRIYVDDATHETYIAALASDPWTLRAVVDQGNDRVYAILDANQQILGGMTAREGVALSVPEIQKAIQAAQAAGLQTGLQGPPQAVVVMGPVAGVPLASLSSFGTVKQWCDAAEVAARNASMVTITSNAASCASGAGCTAAQAAALADASGRSVRLARQQDPFLSSMDRVTSAILWSAVGGISVFGFLKLIPWLQARRKRV